METTFIFKYKNARMHSPMLGTIRLKEVKSMLESNTKFKIIDTVTRSDVTMHVLYSQRFIKLYPNYTEHAKSIAKIKEIL